MDQNVPPDTSQSGTVKAEEFLMNWFKKSIERKTSEGSVLCRGRWIPKTAVEEVFRNRQKDSKKIFMDLIILYCLIFIIFLCFMNWGHLLLFLISSF